MAIGYQPDPSHRRAIPHCTAMHCPRPPQLSLPHSTARFLGMVRHGMLSDAQISFTTAMT